MREPGDTQCSADTFESRILVTLQQNMHVFKVFFSFLIYIFRFFLNVDHFKSLY